MSAQGGLFDAQPEPERHRAGKQERETIEQRSEKFHAQHPDVFAMLVKLCRKYKSYGHDRWSIMAAFQVLRWQLLEENKGDQGFKINNDFTPWYARKIMAECPDLEGFFETREHGRNGREVYE